MAKTWLITGGSAGLGLALGRAVLKHGDVAVLTTRSVEKAADAAPDVEKSGGKWLKLEITDPQVERAVKDAVDRWGIDVLVNCAGYAMIGAVEDVSPQEVHRQMETNFYGPLRIIQAVLPALRANKQGTIVNVSSAACFQAVPSRGIYAASKAALECATEALGKELAPYNIRTLIVNPGAFRTSFATTMNTPSAQASSGGISQTYKGGIVEEVIEKTKKLSQSAPGDPDKAALRIWEAVSKTGMMADEHMQDCPRLVLGNDSLAWGRVACEGFRKNLEAMEVIAASSDYDKNS